MRLQQNTISAVSALQALHDSREACSLRCTDAVRLLVTSNDAESAAADAGTAQGRKRTAQASACETACVLFSTVFGMGCIHSIE